MLFNEGRIVINGITVIISGQEIQEVENANKAYDALISL